MGIYENTFWTHLTFETHSVIWAVTSWSSHCTMYSKYGLLVYRGSMVYFDGRVSAYVFFASGRLWRGHLIDKTQVTTSTKRVPVGQKWLNHGTHVEWEYKSSISWTYLCSGDFKRQAFSPLCAWVRIWVSPVQRCAWRHLNWTGNSIIIGGNASARATTKPCMIKWFHLVPPEYYLATTLFRYFDDNHYIKHTHHVWPSQMHSNVLISGVRTLAIARILTLLINKLSCICEGQSWWVRITFVFSW